MILSHHKLNQFKLPSTNKAAANSWSNDQTLIYMPVASHSRPQTVDTHVVKSYSGWDISV